MSMFELGVILRYTLTPSGVPELGVAISWPKYLHENFLLGTATLNDAVMLLDAGTGKGDCIAIFKVSEGFERHVRTVFVNETSIMLLPVFESVIVPAALPGADDVSSIKVSGTLK